MTRPLAFAAISDPGIRFSFDFGDLRPAPRPELVVVPPAPAPAPPGLEPPPARRSAVHGSDRPRWLPHLLPVFHTRQPLRVVVAGAQAPVWAGRLRTSLAALLASAGARAGLRVFECNEGFDICAGGDPDQALSVPPAVVVAAECDAASLGCADGLVSLYGRERCFVAVHGGGGPTLDRWIGPNTPQVVRFPVVGMAELATLGRGGTLSLTCAPFGRACLGLAQAIVARYRLVER